MEFTSYKDFEEDVEKFNKYLKENYPEVPEINKIWLSKFLKVFDRNFEKSANLLKLNLQTRKKLEIIFKNRNFFAEETVASRNTM